MIARALLMWMFFSSFIGAWLFMMGVKEKTVTKDLTKKGIISGVIGAVIVVIVMLVNNIQGV